MADKQINDFDSQDPVGSEFLLGSTAAGTVKKFPANKFSLFGSSVHLTEVTPVLSVQGVSEVIMDMPALTEDSEIEFTSALNGQRIFVIRKNRTLVDTQHFITLKDSVQYSESIYLRNDDPSVDENRLSFNIVEWNNTMLKWVSISSQ